MDAGWDGELREGSLGGRGRSEDVWDLGADDLREIEGGEDCEAVAETEEGEGDFGDFGGRDGWCYRLSDGVADCWAAGGFGRGLCGVLWLLLLRLLRALGPEDLCESRVLVYAYRHVHEGCRDEFHWPCGNSFKGKTVHGRDGRVDQVCGYVGARVESVDEEERRRGDEPVRAHNE